MRIQLTLTPQAAAIVRKMYENGELGDVGVTHLSEVAPTFGGQSGADNSTSLEAIMSVVIHAPRAYMGDIIGHTNISNGEIAHADLEGGRCMIEAHIPQRLIIRYINEMRSALASEEISIETTLSHYAQIKQSEGESVEKRA
jgi:translation elongation factor EF-G